MIKGNNIKTHISDTAFTYIQYIEYYTYINVILTSFIITNIGTLINIELEEDIESIIND